MPLIYVSQFWRFRHFRRHFFNATHGYGTVAPVLPLLLPAAVTRCVSYRPSSTKHRQTGRQPCSVDSEAGRPSASRSATTATRSRTPTRANSRSVSRSQAGIVSRAGLPAGDGSLMSPMNDSHSYHGFSLIRFGYCFVSCALVIVHLRVSRTIVSLIFARHFPLPPWARPTDNTNDRLISANLLPECVFK